MSNILKQLSAKKRQLHQMQPLSAALQQNLAEWLTVELTYSSNAIEGNTLTRIETAEVIGRGVGAVISGKPFKDLLEARNHAQAVEYIRSLAQELGSHQNIREDDILSIHRMVLTGIDDEWAGQYRHTEVMVKGVMKAFPKPQSVPYAMQEFVGWLQQDTAEHPVRIAAQAHFKLVNIHPFVDGNGRTARLLMNLILLTNGYPMAVIRNEDRTRYLTALQTADTGDLNPFYEIVERAVERVLDLYLNALQGKGNIIPFNQGVEPKKLLKIGELAQETGETIHTLRYWTKQALLVVSGETQGGYQLYSPDSIERVRLIRRLQDNKRLTIQEIRDQLQGKAA